MIDSYQEKYARYYDLLYSDKDYEKECDFVEEILKKYSKSPVKTILEGGCGTGGHAIPLAKRGYEITGIDISEMMIEAAKSRAREAGLNVSFQVGDLRQFDLKQKYDACLCMFSALGYITDTNDFIKVLANLRKQLNKKSILSFDVWNGLAVMRILPSTRMKSVAGKGVKIFRIARPELDAVNHRLTIHYTLFATEKDGTPEKIEETHNVRFFFPLELTHYLSETGFKMLKICPFLDLKEKLDENVWNMSVIAEAV